MMVVRGGYTAVSAWVRVGPFIGVVLVGAGGAETRGSELGVRVSGVRVGGLPAVSAEVVDVGKLLASSRGVLKLLWARGCKVFGLLKLGLSRAGEVVGGLVLIVGACSEAFASRTVPARTRGSWCCLIMALVFGFEMLSVSGMIFVCWSRGVSLTFLLGLADRVAGLE